MVLKGEFILISASVCEIRILEEAGSIEWLGNPEIDTLDCSWIIGTNVGKSVQILFTYLSLPTSTPCEKNYLKVSDILLTQFRTCVLK